MKIIDRRTGKFVDSPMTAKMREQRGSKDIKSSDLKPSFQGFHVDKNMSDEAASEIKC